MLKKIFSIFLIFLFLGVTFSSAFSVNSKKQNFNQQNDNNCDCIELDNKHLNKLENQLNRLEVYSKMLLMLSRHNPELKMGYEELSNDITTLSGIYEELEISLILNDRLICILLDDLSKHFANKFAYFFELGIKSIEEYKAFLFYFFILLSSVYLTLALGVVRIMIGLNCAISNIPL